MSPHSQPLPRVPEDTARIAQAAFRRGNPYMLLRDRLGTLFVDADFADLYPKLGQPACAPWHLALVTLMQFREELRDRRAADAVRPRINWRLYGGSSHEIVLVEGFVVTDKGVGQSDEPTSQRDDGEQAGLPASRMAR